MCGLFHRHGGHPVHHSAHAERLERVVGGTVRADATGRPGGEARLRHDVIQLRRLRIDSHWCSPFLKFVIALTTPATCCSVSFSPSKTWLSRILRSSICCR